MVEFGTALTGEWPENQILIPDWTYFHCPGATLEGQQKIKIVRVNSDISVRVIFAKSHLSLEFNSFLYFFSSPIDFGSVS